MNLKTLFPYGSNAFLDLNHKIQSTEPKPDAALALGGKDKGKKESRGRIALRYRIMRVRLQDEDNAYGSTKGITDALRLCKLIPNDDPEAVSITVEQAKVSHFAEERIELKISYPKT